MFSFFNKKNAIFLLATLIIAILLYFVIPVSIPLILAYLTAVLLNPLIELLQMRLRIKRKFSVILVFLSFVLIIALSGYFITTKVVTEATNIVQNAPQYINDLTSAWLQAKQNFSTASKDLPAEFVLEVSNQIEGFLNTVKVGLLAYVNIDNLQTLLTNIPNYFVSFLVYLMALFLFLLDLPELRKRATLYMSEKTADKVHFMTSRLSYVFFGLIKAQFFVSVIIFIVSLIGLLIISPDIAFVVSLIIWVIDLFPIIGSLIILGPWSLYQFMSGNISMGTQLAILACVLLVIRRTVEPKVMGIQIGLSPLSTLISMYLGLKLFGIMGFIFGPLLLIIFNSAREAGFIRINFKI